MSVCQSLLERVNASCLHAFGWFGSSDEPLLTHRKHLFRPAVSKPCNGSNMYQLQVQMAKLLMSVAWSSYWQLQEATPPDDLLIFQPWCC